MIRFTIFLAVLLLLSWLLNKLVGRDEGYEFRWRGLRFSVSFPATGRGVNWGLVFFYGRKIAYYSVAVDLGWSSFGLAYDADPTNDEAFR